MHNAGDTAVHLAVGHGSALFLGLLQETIQPEVVVLVLPALPTSASTSSTATAGSLFSRCCVFTLKLHWCVSWTTGACRSFVRVSSPCKAFRPSTTGAPNVAHFAFCLLHSLFVVLV